MSDSPKKKAVGCFALIAMAPVATLFSYFVLRQLYQWFIVPVFPSAPHLTVFQVGGLASIFYFLTSHLYRNQEEEDATTAVIIINAAVKVFLSPLLALGMGYITHCLIVAGY